MEEEEEEEEEEKEEEEEEEETGIGTMREVVVGTARRKATRRGTRRRG